jgi:hypothetical protein
MMALRHEDGSQLGLLAYVTGLVNQELLLQNEYLAAENRILRAQLPPRLRLSNPERALLAEIGKRVGRKTLPKSRASLNRTPSWAGAADWLPRSSTGPSAVRIPGDRGSLTRRKS